MSPLSLFPLQEVSLTGVEKNVMQSVRQEFYIPSTYQSGWTYPELATGQKNGLAALFETNGEPSIKDVDPAKIIPGNWIRTQPKIRVRKINCVYPVGLEQNSGLNINVPALVRIPTSFGPIFAEMNIVHTASNVPGFWFSSYFSLVAFFNDILISMESFS